jgi:hypothetical protein
MARKKIASGSAGNFVWMRFEKMRGGKGKCKTREVDRRI